MAQVFLLGIVCYLVFRLVVDLIVPVYKTTKKVRQQFGAMRDQMQQEQSFSGPKQKPTPKAPAEDYLDFEEVK